MKVLFVLEDLLVGGAQKHTIELAGALSNSLTCEILVINDVSPVQRAAAAGVGIKALNCRALEPATWPVVANAIEAARPDLIVTVNQVATLGVIAAGLYQRRKYARAVIFHSTQVTSLAGWARTLPFFPACWSAEALVFVSENQRRIWSARGLRARRLTTIRNGVDVERFQPPTDVQRRRARAEFGFASNELVIGISAVMRREKNHAQLVRALKAVRNRGIPARLLIIGDGPTRRDVEALALGCNIADAVSISGLQPDVRPLLSAIDVGVLCSASIETLSLSALETMAMGIPMIMSDTGGASEIITPDRNGYLFPVNDDAALVDRLSRIHDRKLRLRLGAHALIDVRSHFTYAAMSAAYKQLFSELAGQLS